MNRFVLALAVALALGPLVSLFFGESSRTPAAPVRPPASLFLPPTAAQPPAQQPAAPRYRAPGEDELYAQAAQTAWTYARTQYQPITGLINSVYNYPYATIWDIGSSLAILYSAGELGLLEAGEYDRRIRQALRTLKQLRLFEGTAFNKNYQIRDGVAAGRNDRDRGQFYTGYGWSVTDLGRLLVWLKIIAANQPQYAAEVEAVVDRLDFTRMVQDGYLWGEDLNPQGKLRRYQEGRVGYEQYAAAGFALWEQYADLALRMEENAYPVDVLGVQLPRDRRGGEHLTSEPFILMGLELGWWSPVWKETAERVLAAQQARYEKTGKLTMVSEDALPVPPHYFFYYTLHHEGQDFPVLAMSARRPLTGPRWLSTKAAFSWYALMPGPYTWKVVETVASKAASPRQGWGSGLYEGTLRPTGGYNVNTAAVVLEAALYHRRKQPLLARGASAVPLPRPANLP